MVLLQTVEPDKIGHVDQDHGPSRKAPIHHARSQHQDPQIQQAGFRHLDNRSHIHDTPRSQERPIQTPTDDGGGRRNQVRAEASPPHSRDWAGDSKDAGRNPFVSSQAQAAGHARNTADGAWSRPGAGGGPSRGPQQAPSAAGLKRPRSRSRDRPDLLLPQPERGRRPDDVRDGGGAGSSALDRWQDVPRNAAAEGQGGGWSRAEANIMVSASN